MNMQEAPPRILDLIPWKPSPSSDGHHEDASVDLQPHLWSRLPENLLHSVLERLPFRSVLRFRCVCKQWKALFGSPMFHHLASHRTHIPPWIFFPGISRRRETDEEDTQYDEGHDDNGYVFEEDAHGNIHDSHVVSYVNASDDPRDAHDGADGKDDDNGNENVNARVELLLIFDCESESWHAPLAIPPGFKATSPENFFCRYGVCFFQEQVLIPACSLNYNRLFLFNPASRSCKELPPFICIKKLEGLGFSEETAMLSSFGTSTNLSNLSNKTRKVEGMMAKFVQVVAVGGTGKGPSYDKGPTYEMGTNVVESFNSMTGCWRVCGYLQQPDDSILANTRMVFCKGSFYAKVSGGILTINNLLVGQNMECTLRGPPSLPNRDGAGYTDLTESHLVATKASVFLVGVTFNYVDISHHHPVDWDIIIWQFHPHAPEDACWQLLAYKPKSILDDFYGDIHISTIDYLAHGDLVFFHVPGRQRFLIYDLSQKLWRFSAKCKYFLDSMTLVWEPLLRN